MIGIDTNVLLRYLVKDDSAQSEIAAAFIDQQLTASNPGFVSLVTLVELVWTLKSSYFRTDPELLAIVDLLLASDRIVLQQTKEITAAAMELRAGRASFPDALIAHLNAAAGCHTTVTFDRRATRLEAFTLLGS